MKEIIIKMRDDVDGSNAQETLAFTWRGTDYEIDLSMPNVSAFDADMDKWVKHARVVPKQTRSLTSKALAMLDDKDIARVVKAQRRVIREWALSNRIDCPARGHVPDSVIDAYKANHPREQIHPSVYAGHARLELMAGPALSSHANDDGEISTSQLFDTPPSKSKPKPKRQRHELAAHRGGIARDSAIPDKALRDTIRAWARDNGFTVAGTGFLPRDIVDVYNAEHANGSTRNGEKVHH